ncbi:MAG: ABC transporter permease [Candidatus Marinimicrobia bacterium]|jgi:ABC-type dipeptide/oligopeptide/nickel transport system permease component|nr:ABC transporter permease [Candidatus Neomarinimicrobiota bacterium]
MGKFIVKRILQTIPVVLGVLVISFFLMVILPGDPVLSMVGERYDEKTVTLMKEQLNIDQPVASRLLQFVINVSKGNLGNSFITGKPVLKELIDKFPNTFLLALGAMVIAILVGVSLGVWSSLAPGSWKDKLIMVLALTGISAPVFWVGLVFVLVFGVYLGWLPPTGYGGIEYLILPALTLGLRSAAQITRLTRSSMLDTMGQDFILTARAKKLPQWNIVLKHAIPNSLIPVLTVIGTDFGSYLSGAVLTESIFGWPGMGRLALEAILKRDFPIIQGTVLFMAMMFIIVNLIIDILYGVIDPRIRANRET